MELTHFREKTVLLHAPQEIGALIRDARYIGLLNQYARKIFLVVEQTDLLRHLLEFSFERLEVISEEAANHSTCDFAFDLERLPLLFGEEQLRMVSCPYLKVPETRTAVPSGNKYLVGLAPYGAEINEPITSETIVHAMPIQKRHNTEFIFFPAARHLNGRIPDCFECSDAGAQVRDYADIAALVASLDMVIGLENDVTHLAGALGKPVWLLQPSQQDDRQFSEYYPYVSIFIKGAEQSWEQTLRGLFLYQSLKPSEPLFAPFNLKDITLHCAPQEGLLPFPNREIRTAAQLQELFDLDLTDFVSVSVETTTVCNLRCPYCPHSTASAKAPAFMSDATFYRIMDSLKEFRPDFSGQIIPSMYGEPLLDKRLEKFVRYARSLFPKTRIDLFTNGSFLTVERYKTLKEVGITNFHVSIHAPEMDGDLRRTLDIINHDYCDQQSFNIIPIYYSNKFNRGGLVEGTPPDKSICPRLLRCDSAYRNLAFDHNGNAIICCNDYLSQNMFGNITNDSITQIWNKPGYRRVRNKLLFGNLPLPICRKCFQHV